MKFFKNIIINKYDIERVKGKQLLYRAIYSLGLMKLRMLKVYIITHLKTEFI